MCSLRKNVAKIRTGVKPKINYTLLYLLLGTYCFLYSLQIPMVFRQELWTIPVGILLFILYFFDESYKNAGAKRTPTLDRSNLTTPPFCCMRTRTYRNHLSDKTAHGGCQGPRLLRSTTESCLGRARLKYTTRLQQG